MAKQEVYTEVGGQRLKLTNLDKILYPSLAITKAEVIQYYLSIAPIILKYIAFRPLTVIRFPDGVDGDSFYSKDKPKWTPEWVSSMLIEHEEKSIDYVLANNPASLTWLANLACLELHPMQFQTGSSFCPDQFIVDLDPDETLGFKVVQETAMDLKHFLERHDFTPYIKTSGGKGFHIVVPIIPNLPYEQVTEGVKLLAKKFVATNPKRYTTAIAKQQRAGKVLIDIYRNHLTNTTVAPYSLRGKSGAPISMPIPWDKVEKLPNAQVYNLKNYKEHIDEYDDVWKDWRQHEAPMYLGASPKQEKDTDQRLKSYQEKRDFTTTSEPLPHLSSAYKNRFVLQLHDASNLHYDLRLENDGVLLSWAVPKGLPITEKDKRLAIQTEDHPIKYLNFEGVIPRGQYGAGEMWIVDMGIFSWQTKKEGHLSFQLQGKMINQTFHLNKTKREGQWIITQKAKLDIVREKLHYKPMLASASRTVPKGSEFFYEVKWDGIRTLIYLEDDEIRIISRSGRDITAAFPELILPDNFKVEHAVMDGEIVVLDEAGRPLFHEVISRMHSKGTQAIALLSKSKKAVCYLFDLLSIDGIDIVDQPLTKRRTWLQTIVKNDESYRLSQSFNDGEMLFNAIESKKMEGIIAKRSNSKYQEGQRSNDWVKIKCRYKDEVYIMGYTQSEGERKSSFGALHLARKNENDSYQYMGKVGTGFDQKKLKQLFGLLSQLSKSTKLVEDTIEDENVTVWVAPELKCLIEYASMSSNDTFREPVFIKLVEN